MNIVFAIKSLNVVGGGAERVLVEVANGLVDRGHSVAVLTFDGPGQSFYELDSRIVRLDLDVGPPGQPTPRIPLLLSIPRIRAAVCAQEAELAVGFMHSMYVPLAIALFGSGVPVFASEHIGMQHYEGRGLERWLVKVLSKRLAAKSVPSEVIREHCARTDDCELHVLPNPLPIEEFELGLNSSPASPPVLLAVGRFMTQKNQLELIEAFANLADDFPEWVLRIVGEGEMRQELERKVAQCHVQSRVQMPGAVSAMAEEYAAASFVAMPSLWESFGLATAEALASGRPVVGFADCPGTNELIVHDQNGLLVAGGTNRVRNLEAGLRLLMSDSSLRLRLGASGPASVAKFQACQVTPVWEATFAQYATSGAVQPTGARP